MYEAGTVIAAVAVILAVGFAADYSRWRWWDNPGGRLVMAVTGVVIGVLVLAVVRNVWGDFPGHELARIAVYGGTVAAIVWAWLVHRAAQRGRHRAKR